MNILTFFFIFLIFFCCLNKDFKKSFLRTLKYFFENIFYQDCFEQYYKFISKPEKIDSFSFNENGQILQNKEANKVYLNDDILKLTNLKINLKRNFNSYTHLYSYYKYLTRSNIILHLHYKRNRSLKININNANIFTFRGTLSYLSGVIKNEKKILWAFNVDDVIVIVNDVENDNQSQNKSFINYIGLNFENIICSKKKRILSYL
ncbi:Hypothetical protein SRAE_2000520600 [Strongyloides ratti]|uniref:RAI1-like domain-containing protein n=1 Tax=Strongyloides ratti TaxID=34506 RepID=A0A090LSJ2_STRRB|nr:Hypothetical protein SRAE_2000520600 [Strongyloides ratti]CEF70578.1 Hypothetical protein SRAE_2000520600 [Strongyloides ratti]